ncbi:glycosyltransferase involved in cell wall biosynthesis [Pseudomonas graminis]|uniref:glycosyltransferase family 2 protein n=1 Tax=Pseudomonas graminis TaxID=158627 RepID=UPI001060191E|nr:glycosyltransferase [Pseudomonas graminis]TDV52642.1 glycosyltransferase involved in cell wall biosynthesis [Pseudomonas graminis]
MIPKISVVLPTYNVEAYISETLSSLFNQTVPLFEVIIINDGSTDGTLAVIEEQFGHRPELLVVSQENQGVGEARRRGLATATGDYVFFCDPDDVIGAGLFAEFATRYEADSNIELFYFSKRSFTEGPEGRVINRRTTAATREGWFESGGALLQDLILSEKYHAAMWQYIFRRSVCDRFTVALEGRAHEDHAFSMCIYLHSQRAYAASADYYFYRERTGSLTQSRKNADYVMASYAAYLNTITELKKHVRSLDQGSAVALKFMERNVSALINKCVKQHVKLPRGLTKKTWKNAHDCRVGLHFRLPILLPYPLYLMRVARAIFKR